MNTASVLEAAVDISGLRHGVNYVITDIYHCIFRTLLYFLLLLPLWPWVQFFSLKLQKGFVVSKMSPEPPSAKQVLSLKTVQVPLSLVHAQLAPLWHLNQQHLHFAVQTSVFTIYVARSINQISHVRQRWPIKHLMLSSFPFFFFLNSTSVSLRQAKTAKRRLVSAHSASIKKRPGHVKQTPSTPLQPLPFHP